MTRRMQLLSVAAIVAVALAGIVYGSSTTEPAREAAASRLDASPLPCGRYEVVLPARTVDMQRSIKMLRERTDALSDDNFYTLRGVSVAKGPLKVQLWEPDKPSLLEHVRETLGDLDSPRGVPASKASSVPLDADCNQ